MSRSISMRRSYYSPRTEGESSSEAAGKDVGMITLRVKRVERIGHRNANGLQSIPQTRGNRVVGDHCIG